MKRLDYISWDEYFMGVAKLAARRSKDPSTQVGACIVSPENIIDLNLNDDDYIPPMDLTEVVTALGRNGASRFADEMIDFMQLTNLNRSEKYLTDAAKASGGSLYNIKRIIEDEDFRLQRIEQLIGEGNLRLAQELTQWGEDNDKITSKCEAILTRLNRFFGNDRLYDIFAQAPLADVDFRKWMTEGKVIIIRVPNGRGLGEHAVKTLVHWITLKTFMTRMLMSKAEQENGCFDRWRGPCGASVCMASETGGCGCYGGGGRYDLQRHHEEHHRQDHIPAWSGI